MLVLSGAHRLSKNSIPGTPCEKKGEAVSKRNWLVNRETELPWAAATRDTENSGSF